MKTNLLALIFFLLTTSLFSQVPQGFNYQAIATDGSGNPVSNKTVQVKVSILSDTTGFKLLETGSYLWEEQHSVNTNDHGLFGLVIGTKSKIQGSATSFDLINWDTEPLYVGIKIQPPSSAWKVMGAAKLNSVPYAMMAEVATSVASGSKLSVVSDNDDSEEALFEVKRKDGQTVFAVYPDAINMYVPRSGVKGAKGGFSIGGFEGTKAEPQDYFRVTPDSVRIYIDPTPTPSKGSKGGFAIGGYGETKGINDMYFNLTGASSVNTVMESPQILWYPIKKAFLAGSIHIGAVDSVGQNSTALGYRSIAMGNFSQAFGYKAKAFGDYSTSIGKNSVAGSKSVPIADNAFAFGNGTKATGNDSYAFGSGAIASGYRSFAFGSVGLNDDGSPTTTPTTASQSYTIAIGMGAQATQKGGMAMGIGAISSGYYSNSFGYYSTSSGYYSTALGFRSTASNQYAGAFGYNATANGVGSLALGYGSWAVNDYSTAIGASAKTEANYASAFGRSANAKGVSSVAVGYGAQTAATGTDASAFGKSAIANGPSSIAIGYGATTGASATDASSFGRLANASGVSSMAVGISASSIGANSMAIGNTSSANGIYSTSLGSNTSTSAAASYSTALGYGSTTTGQYSTALGYNAQANGNKSISVGAYYNYTYYRFIYDPVLHRYLFMPYSITKNNIANGDYSLAIGNGNTSADGGTTLGSNNYATGTGALAMGHSNFADSTYSVSIGSGNTSRGYNAFAIGESVYAEAANSIVIGTNNIRDDNYNREDWITTDPLFVIGNGGSGTQSNAMVVAKNGNTTIYGNLTVTGGISSYLGSGDHLGNHIATQNLRMNGYWVSNDGGNEGLWVSTTGNVGVKTSSPAYTFDVSGTSRVTGILYANSDINLSGSLNAYSINNLNNANLTIDAGTFHVDALNNRVGINNTSPTYTLDLSGSLNVTSSGRFGGDVTLSSTSPAFYFTDTSLDQDDFKFEAENDMLSVTTQGKYPVTVLAMSSAGAIGMPNLRTGSGTTLVWNSTVGEIMKLSSSARYKTDIIDLYDISWLYDLKPVDYLYKSDNTNQRQYGLIAEDVVKINKNLVFFDDGEPDAVNYNGLIAPLLKAVQDQSEIIETLKSDNDELKSRLEKLEATINELSKIQK